MNDLLRNVDRASLIRAVAVYLLLYALLNACVAPLMALGGGLASLAGITGGAVLQGGGMSTVEGAAEAAAALGTAAVAGGALLVLSILSLVGIPILLIGAYGLFQRARWGRTAAIIALAYTIVLSVLTLSGGLFNILWIVISGVVLYLFVTDPEIKALLGG